MSALPLPMCRAIARGTMFFSPSHHSAFFNVICLVVLRQVTMHTFTPPPTLEGWRHDRELLNGLHKCSAAAAGGHMPPAPAPGAEKTPKLRIWIRCSPPVCCTPCNRCCLSSTAPPEQGITAVLRCQQLETNGTARVEAHYHGARPPRAARWLLLGAAARQCAVAQEAGVRRCLLVGAVVYAACAVCAVCAVYARCAAREEGQPRVEPVPCLLCRVHVEGAAGWCGLMMCHGSLAWPPGPVSPGPWLRCALGT